MPQEMSREEFFDIGQLKALQSNNFDAEEEAPAMPMTDVLTLQEMLRQDFWLARRHFSAALQLRSRGPIRPV